MTAHLSTRPGSARDAEPTVLARLGDPPRTSLLAGLAGSVLIAVGGFGAGGVPVHDPVLTNSALGFWRYGHGRELATALVYAGVLLMAYSWMRLGRGVLAQRVGGRAVLTTAAVWMLPMLVAPPMFTRDVFSYLAQGALPLAGFDPYTVGPEVLPGPIQENVHPTWQDAPAPYGPLFILVAKAVVAVTGNHLVPGVLLMRLAMLPGLLLLVWALPELTQRMGGRIPVALWIAVANPLTVVHLVGGIHNDLLVAGLLAAGCLLTLRGRHAGGIALVSAAAAVKASAGLALPFLVLVWAARLPGSPAARIARATIAGMTVFAAVFAAAMLAAGVDLGWVRWLGNAGTLIQWYNLPTGIGVLLHALAAIVVPDVGLGPFVGFTRALGLLALLVVAARQWWAARAGGPDAVRRAGIVLLATALLGPTLLAWYPSWGIVLLAMTAWTAFGLAEVVFVSLVLMILTYPSGEIAAQSNVALLVIGGLVWLLVAASLLWPDPLRRLAQVRLPAPEFEVVGASAQRRGD